MIEYAVLLARYIKDKYFVLCLASSYKTLPIPFELGSQTENYPPPPRHIFCHLYFLVVAIPWLLILFCADMTMFLLVDSCLFVGVEPCLRQSVWVAAPAVV